MSKVKRPKPTRADLERKIAELEAQLAGTCHFAAATLEKAGEPHMSASAVIVRLTALGGREVIPPVAIANGLSQATIDALRADIVRTWIWRTELRPKGLEDARCASGTS